jgi:hypothetical protein
MTDTPYAWKVAQQVYEAKRRYEREARMQADLSWVNHVADALTVSEDDDA